MKRFIALLLTPFAVACVSMGTNFDPAQLIALSPGLSETEVIAKLGKPNARSYSPNGEQVLVWSFSHGNAFGGAKARTAALLFDRQSKFVRVVSVSEVQSR